VKSHQYRFTFPHIINILPTTAIMPADPSKDLLLITSASGKQATTLLPLLSEWKNLRLAVKSSSSKTRLQQQYPHAEIVQTDLYSPENCLRLMEDVSVCIHIGPSYHPHEASIGRMMIDSALTSSPKVFKHFILSSVLNSQLSKMLNHACKKEVEEYIMESGLPYTILQPTTFMDNIPVVMMAKQNRPVFRAAWDIDVKFSMVALRDLADVFRAILYERERHFYSQYPLVSTHSLLTFADAMGIVGEKLGKEVKIERLEYKQAVDGLLVRLFGTSEGVDQRKRDVAQRMILFYDNRGLVGNSNVLEWVLNRKATQFDEWVEKKLEEERQESQ
jgi:uncharacterized protein YbjT (DUF2867 family)